MTFFFLIWGCVIILWLCSSPLLVVVFSNKTKQNSLINCITHAHVFKEKQICLITIIISPPGEACLVKRLAIVPTANSPSRTRTRLTEEDARMLMKTVNILIPFSPMACNKICVKHVLGMVYQLKQAKIYWDLLYWAQAGLSWLA